MGPDREILRPGRTCWRLARTDRLAFLVDAAPYYEALRRTLPKAQRSIYIVGWDVDSRTALTPEAEPADGWPQTLLPFLDALLKARPELQVHVLAWDYSFIYALEREPLPTYQFSRVKNRRLHFALDDAHPLVASHHQKIVVVDDRVAFTGGVDLTVRRWDTPAHDPQDPRRVDPAGTIYKPMHDVQVAVDGDAARALGDLVRARWRAATGHALRAPGESPTRRLLRRPLEREEPLDLWPEGVTPDARGAEIALARTAADPGDRTARVREIEALTLEAIRSATRRIFIENQYLTAGCVGEALARRLAEADGPEVVIVLPEMESGWMERGSMGVLRERQLDRLRAADAHGRLRVLYPTIRDAGGVTTAIPVHSKVLVIDDALAVVGSANLSNRSMGLDSEVALAVDACRAPGGAEVVAGLRERLLAEHLGTEPAVVRDVCAASGSLVRAIDVLRGGARSLEPLGRVPPAPVNLAVLDGVVCDPEEPVSPEIFIDRAIPAPYRRSARRTLLRYAALVAVLLGLGAAVRFSPWHGATMDGLTQAGRYLVDAPGGIVLAFGAFTLAAAAFVPVTLLVTAALLTFGFARGGFVAYFGSIAGACLTYAVGRAIGTPRLRRLMSRKLLRIRRQLARRGFAAVLLARLLPVGNFAAINLLAGAFNVPLRPFLAANAVGLLPGVLGLGLLTERVADAFRHPNTKNFALLVLVVALLVAVVVGTKRLLRRPAVSVRIAESHGQG